MRVVYMTEAVRQLTVEQFNAFARMVDQHSDEVIAVAHTGTALSFWCDGYTFSLTAAVTGRDEVTVADVTCFQTVPEVQPVATGPQTRTVAVSDLARPIWDKVPTEIQDRVIEYLQRTHLTGSRQREWTNEHARITMVLRSTMDRNADIVISIEQMIAVRNDPEFAGEWEDATDGKEISEFVRPTINPNRKRGRNILRGD